MYLHMHFLNTADRQTHLISSQDLEGGDDLVGCVCVCRFPGHVVDEGLERDGAAVVGIYDAHDAGKLGVTLATGKQVVNRWQDRIHSADTDMKIT